MAPWLSCWCPWPKYDLAHEANGEDHCSLRRRAIRTWKCRADGSGGGWDHGRMAQADDGVKSS
eukprot:10898042-Karenia_brevis.AAC.1